jgi:hypothetical protein
MSWDEIWAFRQSGCNGYDLSSILIRLSQVEHDLHRGSMQGIQFALACVSTVFVFFVSKFTWVPFAAFRLLFPVKESSSLDIILTELGSILALAPMLGCVTGI